MTKLEFSINLAATPDKLIAIATDYQNFINYVPQQLKKITILETNDNGTIIEEILTFSSFIKNEIVQKSIHKKISSNKLHSEIISGPFKDSILEVLYEKVESGTKVTINADLHIPLKYKIVSLVIKKYYKIFLTAILYKINRVALEL
jgi:ribosome-associated toxin RatA of RatAB toxin-antitoxin module